MREQELNCAKKKASIIKRLFSGHKYLAPLPKVLDFPLAFLHILTKCSSNFKFFSILLVSHIYYYL